MLCSIFQRKPEYYFLIQSNEALRVIENSAFLDKLSDAKICYSNSSVEDFWGVSLGKNEISRIDIVQV